MRNASEIVAELRGQGQGTDEIYYQLIKRGIFRAEGKQIFSINSKNPVAAGEQRAKGSLRISVGNPGLVIPAPRLAWMLHAGQQLPPDSSVIQLGDRRDYSWDNLALIAQGQEPRFRKLLRQE